MVLLYLLMPLTSKRPVAWWVLGVAGIGRAIVGTSASFLELERRPTMARSNDALSVEDVLAASGGMPG